MNHRILFCCGLAALLCLCACGQSGALYLPDRAPVKKPLPLSESAPVQAPAAPTSVAPPAALMSAPQPDTRKVPQKEAP
ncbi:MAG: LPS translocon maturation chaperone LptM [Stenotrophobium sp.]